MSHHLHTSVISPCSPPTLEASIHKSQSHQKVTLSLDMTGRKATAYPECPRGIPRTEGQTSPLLGPFQWGWSYFFIHLFFTDNGDVWALPPTCQSCPGPAPLLRNTPPTLCLPLLVRRTPGPHPTPGYVFKVNGFRCEHLVLTVALYIFCGGGRGGG